VAREKLSAREIQRVVSERIYALREGREDGATIRIPEPIGHAPDAEGRNWDMAHFGNATGYEADIADIVEQTRAEFELVAGTLIGNG
jgi:hypothetical protein